LTINGFGYIIRSIETDTEDLEMVTIQDVNSAIMFGDFTNDQLNSIASAIKFRRGQITKEVKRGLTIGEKVKFVNSRTGGVVIGNVTKVNRKFVIVREAAKSNGFFATQWRVPASMLEVTE
jgi:hypothetical protein